MTAQATTRSTSVEGVRQGFRFRRRHLWWIPGLAVAVLASQLGERAGLGIVPLIAFGIAPHLPALAGDRAIPVFNFGHHPVPPLVLTAIAFGAALPTIWLVAGLVWLSHVVIGWGIGDGLRRPKGTAR
jgi:hypothetical protein